MSDTTTPAAAPAQPAEQPKESTKLTIAKTAAISDKLKELREPIAKGRLNAGACALLLTDWLSYKVTRGNVEDVATGIGIAFPKPDEKPGEMISRLQADLFDSVNTANEFAAYIDHLEGRVQVATGARPTIAHWSKAKAA
jgi:hypothetical protein